MSERDDAITLANKILDRIYADPDDDFAVLARQFLRAIESKWREIGPTNVTDRAILYAPPENLYENPQGKEGEYRIARPVDFCWATHCWPLPEPPVSP